MVASRVGGGWTGGLGLTETTCTCYVVTVSTHQCKVNWHPSVALIGHSSISQTSGCIKIIHDTRENADPVNQCLWGMSKESAF